MTASVVDGTMSRLYLSKHSVPGRS